MLEDAPPLRRKSRGQCPQKPRGKKTQLKFLDPANGSGLSHPQMKTEILNTDVLIFFLKNVFLFLCAHEALLAQEQPGFGDRD